MATDITSPPPATTPALPAATDQAIRDLFGALETTTQLVNLAIDFNAIEPGTPVAFRIANGLDQTRNLLNKASAAERIGNAVLASQYFAQANNTFGAAQQAIKALTAARKLQTGAAR